MFIISTLQIFDHRCSFPFLIMIAYSNHKNLIILNRCYIERTRGGGNMFAPVYSLCADLEDGTGRELLVCRKVSLTTDLILSTALQHHSDGNIGIMLMLSFCCPLSPS